MFMVEGSWCRGGHPLCFVHLLQSQAVSGLGHFASDKAEIL